jgi:hypothetical protein
MIYVVDADLWQESIKLAMSATDKINIISSSALAAFIFKLVKDEGYDFGYVRKYVNELFSIERDSYKCTDIFRNMLIKNKIGNSKYTGIFILISLFHNFNHYVKGLYTFRHNTLDYSKFPQIVHLY